MKKAVIYVHGKGGNAEESDFYRNLCNGYDVFGLDYGSDTPWDAKTEFPPLFEEICKDYNDVTLIANSIGAFFSMNALADEKKISKALFISPIVNMEKLICDMMTWANVTEEQLKSKGEIPTDFGETLSWKYLCYVRQNPLLWNIPTKILYGEKDNLTSLDTVTEFARSHNAPLTVMKDGEHWFHTKEQLEFLADWIKSSI